MKNNKILISVLGRGQYDKIHKCYDYTLTRYKIEENPSVESKLVSDILAREIAPGKIYILGTQESLWHVADDYLPHYEKIEIPYGTNASEFWAIFEAMTSLDVEGKEIYFDVTHGFRSIPLFVSTILNFFENVKNAHIKGVYYGLFEARDKETNTTPVINMLPFLEMNDWIRAFDIFKKYSDGREISTLIHQKFSNIPNDEKKRIGKIQNIARELDFYSKAIGFSAVEFYQDALQKIHRNIQNLEKGAPLPSQLYAANFLLGSLSKEAGTFEALHKKWQKHLCAAELLFEKNRYAQSLTILRETILTYLLEELSLDIEDHDLREKHLGRVIKADGESYKDQKVTRFLSSELILLFHDIRELRNKSNHAFIKKSIGEKDVKKSVENLESYLKGTKDLFENDKAFIDKEGLKTYLTVGNRESKKMFLLFNHTLTQAQKEDAQQQLGIMQFITPPEDLQEIWSRIPPEAESIEPLLDPIKSYLSQTAKIGDFILIQGDFGATCHMVSFTKEMRLIPVYATTKRLAEESMEQGKVLKKSVFEHVRYRRYR